MDNTMHLTYSSSITNIVNKNSSFDSGVIRIAYHGRNRNNSYISKDTYESCMDSIYNCPVVCNYSREDDSIGSHDVELVRCDDGTMKMINMTVPVGVVPESANPYWESVVEDDGTEHEYLCTDVLLWKRQEAYEKIKKDGITNESMEITVKDGSKDDSNGLYVINDFEFTAFCLLGDDVTPCFESASLEVFSYDKFKNDMELMMKDLKETHSIVDNSNVDNASDNSTEGGENFLEEVMVDAEVTETFSEDIDIGTNEESTAPDVEEERNESFAAEGTDDSAVESESNCGSDESYELDMNIRDGLYEAISVEKITTQWGEMNKYSLVDYDYERSLVYLYDYESNMLCGCPYSVDGDSISIDFGNCKRMKWAIVEYDDGSADQMSEDIKELLDVVNNAFNKMSCDNNMKIDEYNSKIDSLNSEISELKEYKNNIEFEKEHNSKECVMSKFAELDGVEAFEALKSHVDEYSVEDLEEKCFAIKGRNNISNKFNYDQKPVRVVIDNNGDANDEPYGGLFVKYGTNK